jgi:dihydroxyacid dehydratase/phosphogluconate dehydratase
VIQGDRVVNGAFGWGAIGVLTVLACVALVSCDKIAPGQGLNRLVGNWVPLQLPAGCAVRQIAAEESGGVAVLCEDGRVFH